MKKLERYYSLKNESKLNTTAIIKVAFCLKLPKNSPYPHNATIFFYWYVYVTDKHSYYILFGDIWFYEYYTCVSRLVKWFWKNQPVWSLQLSLKFKR